MKMNRHMRRAAKNRMPQGALEGIASIAEELKPYLAQIGALQSQLESAQQLLHTVQGESVALRSEMKLQAAVFRRMLASGMGVPLDTIISMETEIQHALKTVPPVPEGSAEDSSTAARA